MVYSSVTRILQWWNFTQFNLTLRRSKKYINHVTHTISSADISIFSPEISNFCYTKKYRYRFYFNTKFLDIWNFFESLKFVCTTPRVILMMPAKLATLRLKRKVFWNKGHDVITSVNTSTTKFYYMTQIIDEIMRPKFSDSRISMGKVITTTIL